MGILLFILAGLLQSYFVVGQGCRGFRFFNGDTEVTNFTCEIHPSSSCRGGPMFFPGNLSQGESVGKPRNFEVILFRRNFTKPVDEKGLFPGATFTWEPPVEKISRKFLKGFYLKQSLVGSGKVICRLIDLQNVDLTVSTEFHFSFELFPYEGKNTETYLVYLTSLPPPSDEEYEELVESNVFTIQPALMYGVTPVVYPSKWLTWINVQLHGGLGIVEMSFGLPEPDSLVSFTTYNVQIVESGQSNALLSDNIAIPSSQTVGRYNFTNIPSGTYRVTVQPWDVFFNEDGECQCWDYYEGQGNVCSVCRVSATGNFIFEADIPQTTTTPPPLITSDQNGAASTVKTGHSTQGGGGGDSQKEVQVIVAVVAALAIVSGLVVMLLVLHRKGKLAKWCSRDPNDHNENDNANNNKKNYIVNIVDIGLHDKAKELKAPPLSRKKVVLLAAQDHECFTQAVDRLGCFLEKHCQCEVTFAPQQMALLRKAPNTYCWLAKQIDSADYVLMVTSEAAYRLYLAFQEGKGYSQAWWGPEGDLFTPGLQHVCGKIASGEDVRHVLRVCLDHTPPTTYRLPLAPLPSFHYQLPAHLATFLHHIHGLDKATMDLSQVNLPLQGNVEELEGGREWLEAVQQAQNYEHLNPQWFEQKFGKPTDLFPASQIKPDYIKQESKDSGFTESRSSRELKRHLSSASNTARDLNGEEDLGVDNGSFIKDLFSPPSMVTANTAYTIPYPGEDAPFEVDNRSITEEFHRLNHQYEQELQLQKQCSLEGESFDFIPPSFEAQAFPQGVGFVGLGQEDEDTDCISVTSAQSV